MIVLMLNIRIIHCTSVTKNEQRGNPFC